MMEGLIELLNEITNVIKYLVPGVVFLSIMDFIARRHRDENTPRFLISCATISFLFNIISQKYSISCLGEIISELLYAIAGGSLIGLLLRLSCVRMLLKNLFWLDRTDNLFVLWHEETPENATIVTLTLNDGKTHISGSLSRVLEPYSSPVLIVSGYWFHDEKGGTEEERDFRGKNDRYIAVNYSDCTVIEYYHMKSELSSSKSQ